MKKLFYLYQRACWYFGIAVAEAKKPLILLQEATLLAILGKLMGIQFTMIQATIIYIVLSILFIVAGKILVITGVVAYNARLNNRQNPELMEILNKIK